MLASLVAFVATPVWGAAFSHFGFLDRPGGLKRHARPVPYGGGLGLVSGLFAGLVLGLGADFPPALEAVFLAGLLVVGLGLVDDARPLSPWAKLAGQTAAAVILIAAGVRLEIRYLPNVLNVVLSWAWFVGMTNAFNMIDVADGLAGLVAATAAAAFACVAALTGDLPLALLSATLLGAVLGFLPYNLPPARVYLGDAGAQGLGFLLSAAAVMGSYTAWNNIAFGSPIVILGWPILDLAYASARRLARGEPPWKGSPDHVVLRLTALGWNPRRALLWIFAIAVALALVGLGVTTVRWTAAVWIYAGTVFLMALLGTLLFLLPDRPGAPGGLLRPRVVGVTGSPASGKSTFARAFAEATGGPCFDADAEVHRLLAEDAEVAREVRQAFGEVVFDPDGRIDRHALAARVFAPGDGDALARLESILHPRVAEAVERTVSAAAAEGAPCVVLDVPLLYESGLDKTCDRVVFVSASEASRRRRIRERGGDPAEYEKRARRFLPESERSRRADAVVGNDGPIEALRGEAERLAGVWMKVGA